ncbi:MAG: hybrid sensor histidine kinase/response regulator, partial [Novosphingobium sp.]|nr:hybrid sensor histidine kinase/response regulator [Novosphingobium sp.]
ESTLAGNITKSLESVEDILGAILAISRLDTGRQETKISDFPVGAILEQMGVEFAPFARERGLDLTIVHSSAWIRSDPALLRRLLQNLISNAIKYTPSGRVLVGCRRHGKSIAIEIIDTGIGIADNDRQAIFAEFRRLDDGVRQAPGLGLGLSIVERIAKVLEIDVLLVSEHGKGTRFSVSVERATAKTAPLSGKARKPSAGAVSKLDGLYVLCIDNDLSILEGMSGLLTQWGCTVTTAPDLDTAFATLDAAHRPPDIVLADYHLERANGIEAIHALRQAFGLDLPCVLVTADRTPSLRSETEAEGIKLIYKPVKPAALRAVLSATHARQEAAE